MRAVRTRRVCAGDRAGVVTEETMCPDEGRPPRRRSDDAIAMWMGVGVAIGTALGAALDELAMGVALGVAFGAAGGLAFGRKGRGKGE